MNTKQHFSPETQMKMNMISAYHEQNRNHAALVIMSTLLSLILLCVGIEYTGLFEIFSQAMVGVYDSAILLHKSILAALSIVMLIAFHLFERQYSTSLPFRILKIIIIGYTILFFSGIGILFSSAAYQSGLDQIFLNTDEIVITLTDQAQQIADQTNTPWAKTLIELIIQHGGLLFIIGLSGVSLSACFAASMLIHSLQRTFLDWHEKNKIANEVKKTMDVIQRESSNQNAYDLKLEALKKNRDALPDKLETHVLAGIGQLKIDLEMLLSKKKALIPNPTEIDKLIESDEEKTLRKVDEDEVKKDLQRITELENGGVKRAIEKAALLVVLLITFIPQVGLSKTLTIALDISGSSPLMASKNFGRIAGESLYEIIRSMKMNDQVTLHTLGNGGLDNFSQTITLSHKKRPSEAATAVKQFLSDIQTKVSKQSATMLLKFLLTPGFYCSDSDEVIVISDGLEMSPDLEMDGKLLNSVFKIPEPPKDHLKGCHITFWGLGRSRSVLSARQVTHLTNAWTAWMQHAGATFKPLSNP